MFDINKFNLKTTKKSDNVSVFELGPFASGYGHTVGNALRRVTYSSVAGVALYAVKVNGVYHEYSSLKGVTDDVLHIILSLKKLVFKLNNESTEKKEFVLSLKKKGISEVTGADIELNESISLVDDTLHITDLNTDKASIDLELYLRVGVGYEFGSESVRATISTMPIDSDYCPVVRVAHRVSPTRLGNFVDLEQVELEIETNGAVSPVYAFQQACEKLNMVFAHLVELTHGKVVDVKKEFTAAPVSKKVDLAIDKLNISTRLYNCLDKIGIKNLKELDGKSKKDIAEIKGLGEKSKKELLKVLEKYEIVTEE